MAEERPQDPRKEMAELIRRVQALENKNRVVRFPSELDINPVITYVSNGTANTEDPVSHGLKRVPAGVIVIAQTAAGSLYSGYSGMTSWTTDKIYVKSSAASVTYKLLLF